MLGYVVTIDPRGLASTTPSFSVLFVTGSTTANSLKTTLSVLPVTIIPGSYDFDEVHGGIAYDLFFTVDNPGFVQSLPTVFDMQPVTGNGTRVLRIGANSPPAVNGGGNLSILSSQQASTILHGTATDPDGDALTYRWLEVKPSGDVVLLASTPVVAGTANLVLSTLPQFTIGGHTLRLESSDLFGTSADVIVLTVDDSPPVAAASGGGVFQDGTNVIVNGHVSDFDGDPITYSWKVAATQEVLAAGMVIPPVGGSPIPIPQAIVATTHLGVGAYTLLLTVNDGINPAVVVPVAVTVIDTQGPTLAPVASTHILFPPNHQLMDVIIQANANDNSGCLTLAVDVKSSEKPDYDDCGHFVPDIQILSVDQATGVIHLLLRAEKSDRGNGIIYTVNITATDCSGNHSSATLTILAPHNRDHD